MSAKITDFPAADARLNVLARGLRNDVGGVLELGRRIAREPNAEELFGVLVIRGSEAKLAELTAMAGARGGDWN